MPAGEPELLLRHRTLLRNLIEAVARDSREESAARQAHSDALAQAEDYLQQLEHHISERRRSALEEIAARKRVEQKALADLCRSESAWPEKLAKLEKVSADGLQKKWQEAYEGRECPPLPDAAELPSSTKQQLSPKSIEGMLSSALAGLDRSVAALDRWNGQLPAMSAGIVLLVIVGALSARAAFNSIRLSLVGAAPTVEAAPTATAPLPTATANSEMSFEMGAVVDHKDASLLAAVGKCPMQAADCMAKYGYAWDNSVWRWRRLAGFVGAVEKPAPTRPAAKSAPLTRIITNPPGATVMIDKGAYSGITPFSAALSPGAHGIQIRKKGYKTKLDMIRVPPSKDQELSFDLEYEG